MPKPRPATRTLEDHRKELATLVSAITERYWRKLWAQVATANDAPLPIPALGVSALASDTKDRLYSRIYAAAERTGLDILRQEAADNA